MDRAPGLSVRLGLTLNYSSGFVISRALLLAAVWLFLTTCHVPERPFHRPRQHWHALCSRRISRRNNLLHVFAPKAAEMMAFLLVFGLLGGWLLVKWMLAPLTRITDGPPGGRSRIALPSNPASRAQ